MIILRTVGVILIFPFSFFFFLLGLMIAFNPAFGSETEFYRPFGVAPVIFSLILLRLGRHLVKIKLKTKK